MLYKEIDISKNINGKITTIGLKSFIDYELSLKSFNNEQGELALLCFLIDYIILKSPIIKNEQSISYGLWLLKFTKVEDYYEIYELDNEFEKWQEGADNAIYYIEQQKVLCKDEQTEFTPPLFTQKLAISKGVLEGMKVQGIRYDEPNQMSGWYLTTPEYDGIITSMSVIDLQELVIKRKDLLQFLALPSGYMFEITENNNCRIYKAPLDPEDN
jgi:hypothetical protein